jgi:hypothetical protein
MKFFFDNDVSSKLARAMKCLEGEDSVVHLTERYAQDTPDEEWLEDDGKEEMVLISRDRMIRKRAGEFLALRRHKVGAFFLTGKGVGKWGEVRQVINAWENIKDLATRTRTPYVYQVSRHSKITRIQF